MVFSQTGILKDTRPWSKLFVAGAMAVTLAAGMIVSTFAATQPANYVEYPFTEAELSNWEVDRAVPSGGFSSIDGFEGRDDVLEMGIEGAKRSALGGFYHTEGLKRDASGAQTVRADLFVDSTWPETNVRAGLWGVGHNEADVISAYPIIEYTSNVTSGYEGWRMWNDEAPGGWTNLTDIPVEEGWNTLEVSLNPQTTIFDYYINGELVGNNASLGSVDLGAVILNSFNYGTGSDDYDVRWSNFALGNYYTKEDCKKGGYAAFGFKNQGQCVASVQSSQNSKHNRE